MTPHRLSWLGVAALIALTANPLWADSDGYFCATPSYLAYEAGFSGSASHKLHVVPLTSPLRQESIRTMPLPDFQVHGMQCTENAVLLLGWDTLYKAALQPKLSLDSEKLAEGGSKPSPFSETESTYNLGSVARPQVIPLGGPKSKISLVTEVTPLSLCELRVVSRLEERDPKGKVRSSLLLYDGRKGAECGR